jgi:hypothetical protein
MLLASTTPTATVASTASSPTLAELRADLDRFCPRSLTAHKAAVEQPEQEVS